MWTCRCRILSGFLGVCLAIFGLEKRAAAQGEEKKEHAVTAAAYIVLDFHTGKILLEENGQQVRQVASLTKAAAALVALAWLDTQAPGTEKQLAKVQSSRLVGGANPMRMRSGDLISVETAIYAAMLGSDNASAAVLAEYIGRQIDPGRSGYQAVNVFVQNMNILAKQLSMRQTYFANPHGLEKADDLGYSTARDMGKLAMAAVRHPRFMTYCSLVEKELSISRSGQTRKVVVEHTHELMGQLGIDGVKTGTTQRAGECLMTSATRRLHPEDRIPQRLLVIVLGSKTRFKDTEVLLRQGWSLYDNWLRAGQPVNNPGELLTLE